MDLKNIIGPPPPMQLYVLRPDVTTAPGPAVHWQLAVAEPAAPASLDTVRIALDLTPTTMDYFANAAWPDNAPELVQRFLIDAFEKTGRVPVGRDTAGFAPDYLLLSELRDFEARYAQPGTPPQIVVQIEAKLMLVSQRKIIGTRNVTQAANAQENTVNGVVVAFNRALGPALGQIVDWVLQTPPPT